MTFPGHPWQSWNSNGAPSDLSPGGVLGPETTHFFFLGWHRGPQILRPVFTPEWPNADQLSCGQHILGRPQGLLQMLPQPPSHPALTPTPPQPTPPGSRLCRFLGKHPWQISQCRGQMLTAGAPPPPPRSPALWCLQGPEAPGKEPSWGFSKPRQSGQVRAGKGALAALWSYCPQVTLERGMCEKAPCGAASQPAAPRGPPTLPPPEGESEIQSGDGRKWEQREGKSFPVKRKEGAESSHPPSSASAAAHGRGPAG